MRGTSGGSKKSTAMMYYVMPAEPTLRYRSIARSSAREALLLRATMEISTGIEWKVVIDDDKYSQLP